MAQKTMLDQIAAIANKAYPIYRETDWKWRGETVTVAHLALALNAMLDGALQSEVGTSQHSGGIIVTRESDGVRISVDIGHIYIPSSGGGSPA